MPLPPRPALVDEMLRIVARRYRVPATPALTPDPRNGHAATALAVTIEQARQALVRNETPNAALKSVFIEALAQLIHHAMREDAGDPAIQAMELRQRAASVREYASYSAAVEADRREVLAAANAIAHPAKRQRMPAGPQRDALDAVYAAASSGAWAALAHAMQRLRAHPESADDEAIARVWTRLCDSPVLTRLQRLDELASDPLVQQYQALCDRNGPRPGSATALKQGSDAQQRGAAVEALATQALEALAQRLNQQSEADGPHKQYERGKRSASLQPDRPTKHDDHGLRYRVVTSMRVPATLPASADRAKSEWDAALLQRAECPADAIDTSSGPAADTAPAWNVILLVEAKASVDAASTDLPRLLRGLQLLSHADADTVYPFKTQQGIVPLRGDSLRTLPTEGPGMDGPGTDDAGTDRPSLANTVLYCCDAPADATPRLLNAASRMQLLSAPASIAFASQLAQGQAVDPQTLEPVWRSLLRSPQWAGVLNQYPQLHQVRALMVHTDDLLAAARNARM